MKLVNAALIVVLTGFLTLTGYVIVEYGFSGFYREVTQNTATLLCFIDLAIALVLIMIWMFRDAKKEGRNPLLYALITVSIGVAGPLFYLLGRKQS